MPRLAFWGSPHTASGLALLMAAFMVGGFAQPAEAGPLRSQLSLVKESIYFDENTTAAHRWHALEQYMVMAYKLGGNSPAFNYEARGICASFQPKHQARLDGLNEWMIAGELPESPTIVPKLTPFAGAANTADAIDLAYQYEVELIGVLAELEPTVTDPALKSQMQSARFESAHMVVRLCEWLLYDLPEIVQDTLAEEKEAEAATTP